MANALSCCSTVYPSFRGIRAVVRSATLRVGLFLVGVNAMASIPRRGMMALKDPSHSSSSSVRDDISCFAR